MSGTTTYPVVYAFGDSLSDSGDAYLLTSSQYASQLGFDPIPVTPPYFQQAYGTTVAGMFSNGPVWVEMLAQAAGAAIPAPGQVGVAANTLLTVLEEQGTPAAAAEAIVEGLKLAQGVSGEDAYLRLIDGVAGGTNFAIGGSVTGVTPQNADSSVMLTSLSAQFQNFQQSIATPVAGALYTVWSGSNDLLNLATNENFSTLTQADIAAEIQAAVANEVAFVGQLVASGAQSVLVLNVPNLGAVPDVTSLGAAAIAAATSVSASFDQALAAALQGTDFGTANVVLEDTYALIDSAIANPAAYGLTNVTDPVYSGSLSANDGAIVSTDPAVQNQYLFFDHQHPTQTGHAFIAAEAERLLGVACFAEGTRIAVPGGFSPVEVLRAGDAVMVRGGAAAVRWVGTRRMALATMANRAAAQPVRIGRGAFGDGVPSRDLLLSPEHAVFCDDVLVPVRALVGCAGIAVDESFASVTYFHIELERHDVLLAEGLPCESWLDTGNRSMFENVASFDGVVEPGTWCAPMVETGPVLDAIRRRLGGAGTQEVRLDRAGVHEFFIAPGTGAVRLASRAGNAPGDARRLGVAIRAVALDDAEVALDDRRLASGFHVSEGAWRWTDGAALLNVGAARSLRVEVVAVLG